MGNPLSIDLRERVVAVVDEGLSRRKAAARFAVSPASAVRWCQRKASDDLARAKQGGDRRSGSHPMNDLNAAAPVSPLRQRLIDDMTMRRFSRETQRNYIRANNVQIGGHPEHVARIR